MYKDLEVASTWNGMIELRNKDGLVILEPEGGNNITDKKLSGMFGSLKETIYSGEAEVLKASPAILNNLLPSTCKVE